MAPVVRQLASTPGKDVLGDLPEDGALRAALKPLQRMNFEQQHWGSGIARQDSEMTVPPLDPSASQTGGLALTAVVREVSDLRGRVGDSEGDIKELRADLAALREELRSALISLVQTTSERAGIVEEASKLCSKATEAMQGLEGQCAKMQTGLHSRITEMHSEFLTRLTSCEERLHRELGGGSPCPSPRPVKSAAGPEPSPPTSLRSLPGPAESLAGGQVPGPAESLSSAAARLFASKQDLNPSRKSLTTTEESAGPLPPPASPRHEERLEAAPNAVLCSPRRLVAFPEQQRLSPTAMSPKRLPRTPMTHTRQCATPGVPGMPLASSIGWATPTVRVPVTPGGSGVATPMGAPPLIQPLALPAMPTAPALVQQRPLKVTVTTYTATPRGTPNPSCRKAGANLTCTAASPSLPPRSSRSSRGASLEEDCGTSLGGSCASSSVEDSLMETRSSLGPEMASAAHRLS